VAEQSRKQGTVQAAGAAEHLPRSLPSAPRARRRWPSANQAALDQAAQEDGPERFGFSLADIDRDDRAAAAFVNALGDQQRLLTRRPPSLTNLRVEEETRVAAF
jgi:hypothetical protein